MTGQKQDAGAVDDCRGGRRCPPLRNYKKENHSEGVVFLFVIAHRFCCSHPRISQGRGSVRGKPLRVSPLAFNHPPAGDRFCAAKSPLQKNTTTQRVVVFFLERATRLELASRHPANGIAIRRNPASPLNLTRFAQVEAASSNLPAAFQKQNPIPSDGVLFLERATRLELASRHPANGIAIRRNPASPLNLTRFAQVEAASSNLPAAFQKQNPIPSDGVLFL